MKKFVALAFALLSLNCFAYGNNDCSELKSKDLAWVCRYMYQEAFSGIDGCWMTVNATAKVEEADLDNLHDVVLEILNEREIEYFSIDIDSTMLNQENIGSEMQWIFSENPTALPSLKEFLSKSQLKAYAIVGTFIYRADEGFVFVDPITREAYIIGGGDS